MITLSEPVCTWCGCQILDRTQVEVLGVWMHSRCRERFEQESEWLPEQLPEQDEEFVRPGETVSPSGI